MDHSTWMNTFRTSLFNCVNSDIIGKPGKLRAGGVGHGGALASTPKQKVEKMPEVRGASVCPLPDLGIHNSSNYISPLVDYGQTSTGAETGFVLSHNRTG
jgi:hypothetical protein